MKLSIEIILWHTGKQGPRTLEDPGPLRTQDPRGPRILEDLGPYRTQDLEDPGPLRVQETWSVDHRTISF